MAPGVPLHALDPDDDHRARAAGARSQELGFARVVLARELSIAEIRKIKAASADASSRSSSTAPSASPTPASASPARRSAAAPPTAAPAPRPAGCPTTSSSTARPSDLGDKKYLLSPQDLAAYELVPELMDLVVVASRSRAASRPRSTSRRPPRPTARRSTPRPATFSTRRGRCSSSRRSRAASRPVPLRHQPPDARPGPLAEEARRLPRHGRSAVERAPASRSRWRRPLKPGDGIVYDYGKPQDDEPGGRVSYLWNEGVRGRRRRPARRRSSSRSGECPAPQVGWKVWKTERPRACTARCARRYEKTTGARVPVDAIVGEPTANSSRSRSPTASTACRARPGPLAGRREAAADRGLPAPAARPAGQHAVRAARTSR